MSRYTGPACRLCRREGQKLFLKGQKCYTEKCPVERRAYPPGQHGPAQARRRKQVFLKDWEAKLDEFLAFNERNVLANKGGVSRADADARAEAEYEAFAARRRALLEAEGERAAPQALEDAARKLPKQP